MSRSFAAGSPHQHRPRAFALFHPRLGDSLNITSSDASGITHCLTREASFMSSDPLDFHGIDYVEFYVSNARQAAHYYRTALGLVPVAYSGLETGVRDRASWLLSRGQVHFLLTSPLGPESAPEISRHIAIHGDGVRDIALRVSDARAAYEEALRRGAKSAQQPQEFEDGSGRFVRASIATYGDTVHSFIQRQTFAGSFQASKKSKIRRPHRIPALRQSTTLSGMSNWGR